MKCVSITAKSEFEQSVYFWKARYEFHIYTKQITVGLPTAPTVVQGWPIHELFLDQGYHELGPDNKPRAIVKGQGFLAKPALLNGSGAQTGAGQPPSYLQFQLFNRTYFELLDLP